MFTTLTSFAMNDVSSEAGVVVSAKNRSIIRASIIIIA